MSYDIIDFKIERLHWIIQICPLSSHETLKAENLLRLTVEGNPGEIQIIRTQHFCWFDNGGGHGRRNRSDL